MAGKVVLLDTSILIDYFRKTDKTNSLLYRLSQNTGYSFLVSSITTYEIYAGINAAQQGFWDGIFQTLHVIPFNSDTALIAAQLNLQLKAKRKQIALPDLFIAATALQSRVKIATINKRHFDRIESLELLESD